MQSHVEVLNACRESRLFIERKRTEEIRLLGYAIEQFIIFTDSIKYKTRSNIIVKLSGAKSFRALLFLFLNEMRGRKILRRHPEPMGAFHRIQEQEKNKASAAKKKKNKTHFNMSAMMA